MSNVYKIIVTGPFNSGKTQFIQTISDIDVVTTERKITTEDRGIKAETTVAMDYGRVEFDDKILHLNGTPGQVRFDFMWEILASEMNGFVVLVDSCDRDTMLDVKGLLRTFRRLCRRRHIPYLVVANKQDKEGAWPVEKVRKSLGLKDVPVLPCIAKDKSSVRHVLEELQALLP